jgi:hypothetical protein
MTIHNRQSPLAARSVSSRPRSGIELRRRYPAITCISCQVIYLTFVPLPSSVRAEHWMCTGCLCDLLEMDYALGGRHADKDLS